MKQIKVFLYNTIISLLLVEILNKFLHFTQLPDSLSYYFIFFIGLGLIIAMVHPILKFFIIKPRFYSNIILLTILTALYFIGADLLFPGFRLNSTTVFDYTVTGYIVSFIVSFVYAFCFYLIYELKE